MKSGFNKWILFVIYVIINAVLTHFLFGSDAHILFVVVPIVLVFEFGIASCFITKFSKILVGLGICIVLELLYLFIEFVLRVGFTEIFMRLMEWFVLAILMFYSAK